MLSCLRNFARRSVVIEMISTTDWATFGLWWVVFALAVVGLIGTVIPAVPGLPLIFAACLLAAWLGDFEVIGFGKLVFLAFLTLIGLVVEWVAQAVGAKKTGASSYGVTGALVGTVIGLFFGVFGILFMPLLGAVIGELLAKRSLLAAGGVGLGTWIGMLVGAVVKIVLGLVMIGILTVSLMNHFAEEPIEPMPQKDVPAEMTF